PAKYFLIAWSVFLIGIFLWVLKDIGVLPYNNLTNNFMQIGSGIETVLLSFALAARINIYKKERLEAIAEKERLVREQNIVLEQQVVERTKSLNETLDNLKQTQSQLVEAEKMASLGQLTAGIAHEVNNPINFITSNIYPLREDIKDIKAILNKYAEINTSSNLTEKLEEIEHLKEELQYDYLLNELDGIIHGIEDGAMRTAEIVSGLRNFSRLDESDLKLADINEGINSTLLLLKSKIGDVKLIKKLENLPQIECYPGKINQLVLNIVDNAIFAIKEKGIPLTEGEIEVKTVAKENEVVLTIKDNGVGMNEQTKQKIFDPFFTTKDVGEGTGLGLSIVFGIIKKHNATIEITSELGIGTEFKISLPINNK
ncbi:MAG: GHKL domain-containing protein, partial [Flavobacteriales bacterium]|nr:GHKL domain-containing protein [Flavobacteriales bacterium]